MGEMFSKIDIDSLWQLAIDTYKNYWGDGLHIVLLLIALVYIIFLVKDKGVKSLLVPYVIVFTIVFVFPITEMVILKALGDSVYWRMFWLLPSSIIVAFAFTHMTERVKAKWIKIGAILALAVVIAFAGTWVYNGDKFQEAPNAYKVKQVVPEVCEVISNDAAKQGIEPKAVVVNSLVPYIRQYDAGINLLYGRNAMRRENMNEVTQHIYDQMLLDSPDYELVDELLKGMKCNYLVWRGPDESYQGFEGKGYRIAGEVEDYKIYFIDI